MNASSRPIIYLDFDGVLNVVCSEVTHLTRITGFRDHRREQILGTTVTWSPEVLNRITAFRESADIHWLSSWRQDTADIETVLPVRLDGWLDFANEGLDHSGKLEALLADQQNHPRPFIWVDDEEHRYYRASRSAGVLPTLHKHLLIEPSTYAGLTVQHFDRIEAFLAGLR